MTIVAQNFKIFLKKEKRAVRGSALVTLSDTKQGFNVPRGKQKFLEYRLCHICKILNDFILFVFATNLIVSTRHDFFFRIQIEKLSLQNRWLTVKVLLI